MPETPEIELTDMVRLAEISAATGVKYVRPDEVRKILIKMGLELTEPETPEETPGSTVEGQKKKRFVTMGDDKVCSICAPHDGKIYVGNRGPRIPLHDGCRCHYEPA